MWSVPIWQSILPWYVPLYNMRKRCWCSCDMDLEAWHLLGCHHGWQRWRKPWWRNLSFPYISVSVVHKWCVTENIHGSNVLCKIPFVESHAGENVATHKCTTKTWTQNICSSTSVFCCTFVCGHVTGMISSLLENVSSFVFPCPTFLHRVY